MQCKCRFCNTFFSKDNVEWVQNPKTKHYFHKACYEREMEYTPKLNSYILQLFDIKKITPKIHQQITKFQKEGLNSKEILMALLYHYKVKGNGLEASNGGIGIVPYVVQEALEYFEEIDRANALSKEDLAAIHSQKPKKTIVIGERPKPPEPYNPFSVKIVEEDLK